MMKDRTKEKGSLTVEFALIVPVILMLVLAIVEFGIRYQRGTVIENAAFVAAKNYTVNHDVSKATSAAVAAGAPSTATITVSPSAGNCSTGNNVTVTISATETSATGAFGQTFSVNGTGVARCDG